jgi:hypothetical protein
MALVEREILNAGPLFGRQRAQNRPARMRRLDRGLELSGQAEFALWTNGQYQLLMETMTDGRGDTACALYQPLTHTNNIADTIAAIP